jgi:hypothetical protein
VYADESVWVCQKVMAQLYDVEIPTLNYHLRKVFSDNELQEEAVIGNFRITAGNGKAFFTRVLSQPKIWLMGSERDLGI